MILQIISPNTTQKVNILVSLVISIILCQVLRGQLDLLSYILREMLNNRESH